MQEVKKILKSIELVETNLVIDAHIINAPPVDLDYIIKDGFVMGSPLEENERRDLKPVEPNQLKQILSDFIRVGKKADQNNVLVWVRKYGLPLGGNMFKQSLKDIQKEATEIYRLAALYKKVAENEINEDNERYETYFKITESVREKISRVNLNYSNLIEKNSLIDKHHAGGLYINPALYCPDLISYIYLKLYLIISLGLPMKICKGCNIPFPPKKGGDFCSKSCYKAWWKREIYPDPNHPERRKK